MDMKSNGDNAKNSLDSEKSLWERFETELKTVVFGVLFSLLKDEEPSIYTSTLITIV